MDKLGGEKKKNKRIKEIKKKRAKPLYKVRGGLFYLSLVI